MAAEIIKMFQERVFQSPNLALAVVAISVLTSVIKESKSTTMMELNRELEQASEAIINKGLQGISNLIQSGTSISLTCGCELFKRYVTRQQEEVKDFNICKQRVIERGEYMAKNSERSRTKIVKFFEPFIRDGMTILIHGYSRVVLHILLKAVKLKKRFSVIVTESRPDAVGYKAARVLTNAGIPVTLIIDSAVGHFMHKIDFVLFGAEGVVENGGIINKIGTFQIAIVAKAHKKPIYVAAESFKFVRQFPLLQSDIECLNKSIHKANFSPVTGGIEQLSKDLEAMVKNPNCDYTPPQYITLLFSDLGILTTSAVSDELIKLYY